MFFGTLKVVPTDPDTAPSPSLYFFFADVERRSRTFPDSPRAFYILYSTRFSSRQGVPKPTGFRQNKEKGKTYKNRKPLFVKLVHILN